MTRSTTPRPIHDVTDRLTWERVAIDKARDDIRRGDAVSDDEVDTWLDRFVNGPDPLPIAGQPIKTAED